MAQTRSRRAAAPKRDERFDALREQVAQLHAAAVSEAPLPGDDGGPATRTRSRAGHAIVALVDAAKTEVPTGDWLTQVGDARRFVKQSTTAWADDLGVKHTALRMAGIGTRIDGLLPWYLQSKHGDAHVVTAGDVVETKATDVAAPLEVLEAAAQLLKAEGLSVVGYQVRVAARLTSSREKDAPVRGKIDLVCVRTRGKEHTLAVVDIKVQENDTRPTKAAALQVAAYASLLEMRGAPPVAGYVLHISLGEARASLWSVDVGAVRGASAATKVSKDAPSLAELYVDLTRRWAAAAHEAEPSPQPAPRAAEAAAPAPAKVASEESAVRVVPASEETATADAAGQPYDTDDEALAYLRRVFALGDGYVPSSMFSRNKSAKFATSLDEAQERWAVMRGVLEKHPGAGVDEVLRLLKEKAPRTRWITWLRRATDTSVALQV